MRLCENIARREKNFKGEAYVPKVRIAMDEATRAHARALNEKAARIKSEKPLLIGAYMSMFLQF